MGSFSIWHWLIVLVVVLLFFGAGRLPSVMGDLAKGIKNFKAGMRDQEEAKAADDATPARAESVAIPPAATTAAYEARDGEPRR